MNDPLCREIIAFSDFCLARFAAAERFAFFKKLMSRSKVDGAVHAPAAKKRIIRGIHERIDLLLRNIALND
jgi:hypothetical protein